MSAGVPGTSEQFRSPYLWKLLTIATCEKQSALTREKSEQAPMAGERFDSRMREEMAAQLSQQNAGETPDLAPLRRALARTKKNELVDLIMVRSDQVGFICERKLKSLGDRLRDRRDSACGSESAG